MKKEEKTNVMRVLEQKKIAYQGHTYEPDATKTGREIALLLGQDPSRVFKTLVTAGKPARYYVFVIPVESELDLKKAAAAAGEKSVSMIPQKELLPLTGYIHGGCSPIGMKKFFPTTVDLRAQACPTIMFSAGKIGYQVELAPEELGKLTPFQYADLCE